MDINEINTLKNMGIDKKFITEHAHVIGRSSMEQQDVSHLKKEILETTHNQLVDLAKQFQTFANSIEQRLDRLEQRMKKELKQENQDILQGQQHITMQQDTQEDTQPEKTIEVHETVKQEPDFKSSDVSIEKMFNFSNTKGQAAPKPNRD
ncbi:MAG: hypothetical protein ACMXYC_01460 [Candidatus Woesearchaeota archaeon]